MVSACPKCQAYMRANQKEPMIPHDVPKRPWHTLASDLFHLDGVNYLLTADYYSKFPVVKKLKSTTSSVVIQALKATFSEFGIPSRMMTDNGPQYSSEEFKQFCNDYGFQHVTSSPRYPQSNGFVERMVQTVKATLRKASDPHLAMLCLRTTPIDYNIPAPCILLNNRQYQSNLPLVATHNDGNVNVELQRRQDKQKYYYDRNAKPLQPLVKEEPIRVWKEETKRWEPAKVINAENARSYNIETADGQTYRRNRRHLRPDHSTSVNNQDSDDRTPMEESQVPQGQPPECPPTPEIRRSTRICHEPKYLEDYIRN